MPKCEKLKQVCEKLEQYPQYRTFKAYCQKVLGLGNDSLEKTIAIAVALCLVCAVFVSFSAVALKPLQVSNKALDMKKNILDVAGLLEADTDIEKAFSEKIESKLVNLETGEYADGDADAYDQRKAAKDPAQNVAISKDKDIAHIRLKAKSSKSLFGERRWRDQINHFTYQRLWFVVNALRFFIG